MGQTLTHGIYLPDEGERNCYNGLAANWQILDSSVGTIAEHTSALAGKAPLVHTHVKSDVTDLLNSDFIPSANNSYDLGSSSYQWNNLYAKNYYYNGTAWGLDKANVWSEENTFTSQKTYQVNNNPQHILKCTGLELGVQPTNSYVGATYWFDKNNNELGLARFVEYSSGIQSFEIYLSNKAINGNLSPSGNAINTSLQLRLNKDNSSEFTVGVNKFVSIGTNPELGSSTYKWKTLNGVNPGALSLPSATYTGSIAITEIDRTGWVYDGTVNTYSPPVDCWLSISNGGTMTVWGVNTAFGMKATDNIAIPLRQGATYTISLTHTPDFCRIYPCNGNV